MGFKIKNIQKTIYISKKYTPAQREMIGEMIIDKIIERTHSGTGYYNGNLKSFPKYEKEYAKEKGSSKVNLDLTGDMLSELTVVSHTSGEIKIGYKKDSEVAGQAEGNFIGSYGRDKADPSKARPILGVTPKELDIILAKVEQKSPEEATQASKVSDLATSLADKLVNSIIGNIGEIDEE